MRRESRIHYAPPTPLQLPMLQEKTPTHLSPSTCNASDSSILALNPPLTNC